ncbi:hypothetical protein AGRA3207_007618 [Actinomadura graeca]|uniref:Uncharacterized protein n=1 Tax=Actinomadura graeca TaxID=2750812 RepID=A0ABX8R4N0_9ACTN|nr:hypothetical protein [Actinomadura graeca]QXJ26031.1 hypothetical protein AGRA3207_007618 [Actinomadura graeca]
MTVTFPVPSTTTSRFAVAADHIPHDLAEFVRSLPGAYGPHIAGRLGTPQLHLRREDLADLRWDPAQIKAVHPEQRPTERAFSFATGFAIVTSTAPVTDQPRAAQVARAAAHALATATRGIAADLVTGQILQPIAERTTFVLADGWLGDILPPYRANGRCTAAEPDRDPEGVNGCSCVRLRTSGLRRFGLPELQITDVACPHDLAALNVLRTTARHLLSDHWSWLATGPASRTRTISANRHLTETDFSEFWGSTRREHLQPSAPFEALLTPVTPRLLSVSPPRSFAGTVNDWLWGDTLPPGIRDVLSSPADTPLPKAA